MDEWLIFGKKCREFELEFADHLGKDYGILTNSGSSANLLMTSVLKQAIFSIYWMQEVLSLFQKGNPTY